MKKTNIRIEIKAKDLAKKILDKTNGSPPSVYGEEKPTGKNIPDINAKDINRERAELLETSNKKPSYTGLVKEAISELRKEKGNVLFSNTSTDPTQSDLPRTPMQSLPSPGLGGQYGGIPEMGVSDYNPATGEEWSYTRDPETGGVTRKETFYDVGQGTAALDAARKTGDPFYEGVDTHAGGVRQTTPSPGLGGEYEPSKIARRSPAPERSTKFTPTSDIEQAIVKEAMAEFKLEKQGPVDYGVAQPGGETDEERMGEPITYPGAGRITKPTPTEPERVGWQEDAVKALGKAGKGARRRAGWLTRPNARFLIRPPRTGSLSRYRQGPIAESPTGSEQYWEVEQAIVKEAMAEFKIEKQPDDYGGFQPGGGRRNRPLSSMGGPTGESRAGVSPVDDTPPTKTANDEFTGASNIAQKPESKGSFGQAGGSGLQYGTGTGSSADIDTEFDPSDISTLQSFRPRGAETDSEQGSVGYYDYGGGSQPGGLGRTGMGRTSSGMSGPTGSMFDRGIGDRAADTIDTDDFTGAANIAQKRKGSFGESEGGFRFGTGTGPSDTRSQEEYNPSGGNVPSKSKSKLASGIEGQIPNFQNAFMEKVNAGQPPSNPLTNLAVEVLNVFKPEPTKAPTPINKSLQDMTTQELVKQASFELRKDDEYKAGERLTDALTLSVGTNFAGPALKKILNVGLGLDWAHRMLDKKTRAAMTKNFPKRTVEVPTMTKTKSGVTKFGKKTIPNYNILGEGAERLFSKTRNRKAVKMVKNTVGRFLNAFNPAGGIGTKPLGLRGLTILGGIAVGPEVVQFGMKKLDIDPKDMNVVNKTFNAFGSIINPTREDQEFPEVSQIMSSFGKVFGKTFGFGGKSKSATTTTDAVYPGAGRITKPSGEGSQAKMGSGQRGSMDIAGTGYGMKNIQKQAPMVGGAAGQLPKTTSMTKPPNMGVNTQQPVVTGAGTMKNIEKRIAANKPKAAGAPKKTRAKRRAPK